MSRTDPDLTTLREALADVGGPGAEPSAEAVSRTWRSVNQAQLRPQRATRRWVNWVAVPAAAASVIAVALVASTLLRPGPGVIVGAGPTPAPTKVAVPATPEPTPTVAVTDFGTTVRSVPLSQAVNAMATAAAGAAPLTIHTGQFLYLRTEDAQLGVGGQLETRVHELWLEPTGMYPVKIVINGRDAGAGDPPSGPPSLANPTPEYLAALSTNPATLYTMFAHLNDGVKLGGAHYVTKELFFALRLYGAILPPATRAAFFRVLTRVPGATASEIQVAGHTYLGFRDLSVSAGVGGDLLCDPATGQVVGERYTGTGIELWRQAVVNAVGQTA